MAWDSGFQLDVTVLNLVDCASQSNTWAFHFKVKGSKHCKSRREAYLVQKLLAGALLWAAAPIGQEVAEAGGGLANQGSSLVFCWFLGTIKVLRPLGSGKYLSCILCKSF